MWNNIGIIIGVHSGSYKLTFENNYNTTFLQGHINTQKLICWTTLIVLHEQYLSNMCSVSDFNVSHKKIFCDIIFRE